MNWALTDHQGTVRDVVDSSGAVQNHIRYDSFGQITIETNGAVDFRFSYTGREFDEETGQYYYRSRYYNASNGRFLSEDTIGFEGGDANLYRYVGNSPLNGTDPFGEDWYRALDTADEFAAGFADTVTFSTSTQLREFIYGDTATQNHQGAIFTGGQVTGAIATTALGFGAPTRLAGGVSWAQRFAQGYTVASTGVGAYRSTRNIMEGCGTWTDYLAYAPLAGYAGGRALTQLSGTNIRDSFIRQVASSRALGAEAGSVRVVPSWFPTLSPQQARNIPASSPNASNALNRGLRAIERAQEEAVRTRTLPDGRIRYYNREVPARTPGLTRGRSHVTEYNPQTGRVRTWEENYSHSGDVIRVHPKMIDGLTVELLGNNR